MKKKPKRGRPRSRHPLITRTARFTDADFRAIERAARLVGVLPTQFIRQAAVEAAERLLAERGK